MQFALHGGLILALLISFSQAPQDHFHPGDANHDHDHHAEEHSDHRHVDCDHEPSLDALDHDSTARLKDWLAGDGSTSTKQDAELVALGSAEVLAVVERAVPLVSLKNHDPPPVQQRPARGPPTFTRL